MELQEHEAALLRRCAEVMRNGDSVEINLYGVAAIWRNPAAVVAYLASVIEGLSDGARSVCLAEQALFAPPEKGEYWPFRIMFVVTCSSKTRAGIITKISKGMQPYALRDQRDGLRKAIAASADAVRANRGEASLRAAVSGLSSRAHALASDFDANLAELVSGSVDQTDDTGQLALAKRLMSSGHMFPYDYMAMLLALGRTEAEVRTLMANLWTQTEPR